ncbi:MAG: diaminopimelate epimerase [bacterium]|nr:diaminopimelate epimerase [bacterium]MXV89162.1 diaminopimelate epimerase [Acidimicrobiia bacterium]MYC44530.1 diaminopimelate epimerase [Acidimicrobiia bacterium]MYI20072.1 diaminopimelate epimerase [Acidimicrobiia bacterium]
MHLTKHHVFGNDFLVRLEPDAAPCPPGWVRGTCDRTRGIGADGIMWARAPAGPGAAAGSPQEPLRAEMRLYNADGGEAEVSGNGLACLAQALTLRAGRAEAEVLIATVAGERRVAIGNSRFADADDAGTGFGRIRSRAAIGLGQAGEDAGKTRRADALLAELVPERRRAGWVSVGNPHLVALLEDTEALEALALEPVGAALQTRFEPVNFEAVTVVDRARVRMRVFERGVGVTSACGSGAAAVAWRLHDWGLVDEVIEIDMPGGVAEVNITSAVELRVPVIYVADVEAPEPAVPTSGGSS